MIIDVTGVVLIPGNGGNDCPGNGEHTDQNGNLIECCCDECNYLLCCLAPPDATECQTCADDDCPRNLGVK